MKFASSITIAFIFAVQSALATTLYRNGGATKAYNSVRTPQDYDKPVKGLIPANSKKGVRSLSLSVIEPDFELYFGGAVCA